MEFMRWFTIAAFISGAIFVTTDISADSSLFYKYTYQYGMTLAHWHTGTLAHKYVIPPNSGS